MNTQSDWIRTKEKESAVDFVISSIRDALISKKLKPGDRLPSELELAASMQVSRSTIREAMKVLSAYGIIDVYRGNGTFISKNDDNISMDAILFGFLLSQPSFREQLEFRRTMERVVMNLAIQNASEENIRELEENYNELLQISDNSELSTENDIEFHRILGQITGNRLISRVYMFSITYFASSIKSTHKNSGLGGAVKVHKMTLDTIRDRNYAMIDRVIEANTETWIMNADKQYFGDFNA